MDREIPKEVRNKERNKKIIRYSSHRSGRYSCYRHTYICHADRSGEKRSGTFPQLIQGMIEVSVSASGKVVPAFEEIINSPINSRIR